MPRIWYEQGFTFSFFSADGHEPPHIHVVGSRGIGKWWLEPVAEDRSRGFTAKERATIARIIRDHQGYMLERWRDFFSEAG